MSTALVELKKSRKPKISFLGGAEAVSAVRRGLPFSELERLRSHLDVPQESAASFLGISPATFHRRKSDGILESAESDRLIRYLRIWTRALEVFESAENARAWLKAPQFGLGREIPLEYAKTEAGAREVEALITRIDHTVYS